MSERDIAEEAKKKNILDMALTFTAMMRNFNSGSKKRITQKLGETTDRLHDVRAAEDYEKLHNEFCGWFCGEIRTAEKTDRNSGAVIKPSQPASFGQAAKVLNVARKVYVFYCVQPSAEVAARIHPFLHAAADVPIMNHLRRKYAGVPTQARTIEQVDESTYRLLRTLVSRDIRDNFQDAVSQVQYDDIMWQKLNRT